MTRACEVLAEVRRRAPGVGLAVVGSVPEPLVRRAIPGDLLFRRAACDVGLVQADALHIDEAGTAAACAAFDASWDARADAEADFLREAGVRLVVADIPPLAFEAAHRAGIPPVGLGNFSWDWIYRHLAARQPSLAASAERAAAGLPARRAAPRAPLRGRPLRHSRNVNGSGWWPGGPASRATRRGAGSGWTAGRRCCSPSAASGCPGSREARRPARRSSAGSSPPTWTDASAELGLTYPDVVRAVDVVVTKPGYGIVTDAIAAGTRLVYTERGDFPEYPILVREMAAAARLRARLRTPTSSPGASRGRCAGCSARPVPPPPTWMARRAARPGSSEFLGQRVARPAPPG